eukprot:TRINITY_DN5814_c0_g1_i1.p1 TRINITY_DN5814_c0_g1~~TRINITY_DN5814_c0_g1_i1.p1  ORF type:complete len:371 (-),score=47.53 TRINITY_DN5814_c0_g1_i1:8-1120(-)
MSVEGFEGSGLASTSPSRLSQSAEKSKLEQRKATPPTTRINTRLVTIPRTKGNQGNGGAPNHGALNNSMMSVGESQTFVKNVDVLRKFILDAALRLVTELNDRVDASEYTEIARSLVKIFQANVRSSLLIDWAISYEVNSYATKASPMLREDSLQTQIIAQYFTLVGEPYLRTILQYEVIKMVKSPNTSQSRKRTRKSASSILKVLCSSASQCPRAIGAVCYKLNHKITDKFPEQQNAIGLIASFFMLRFVCPAIVNPAQYGLLKEKIENGDITTLVSVAKLLQSLANAFQDENLNVGDEKDNRFLKSKSEKFKNFILSITSVYNVMQVSEMNEEEGVVVTVEEEKEALVSIQQFVAKSLQRPSSKPSNT